MNFWDEIRRRHVVQVGLIYLAAAWGLAQVAEFLFEAWDVPGLYLRLLVIALAFGLPVMVAVAWIFELRGLSLIPQQKVDDDAAGVVVIPPAPPHEKSIAVLPFVNMSDDESNEYFSDGISEELLNLLAKINDLKVISRSSAFAFKGKDVSIKEIASKLNCANVLEGSVRKMGNQVRITAQLIQAETDTHLWSETYDRTLDDIFKVQDDIAAMVVEELKAKLLGAMPKVRETDPETYALYLQAHHLSNQGTKEAYARSVELCQEALARDPDYAPAWICLGRNKTNQAGVGIIPHSEGLAEAKLAYESATRLDPQNAQVFSLRARNILNTNGDLREAADLFRKAIRIAPRDASVLNNLGVMFRVIGRIDEAIIAYELKAQADPANPLSYENLAVPYSFVGDTERTIASARKALNLSPSLEGVHESVARALLLKGDSVAALDELMKEPSEVWRHIVLPTIYHSLGQLEQSDSALNELIEKHAKDAAYDIAYVHAFRGSADCAFEWLDKAVEINDPGLQDILVEPFFESIRNDPRWLLFLRKIARAPEQLADIKLDIRLADIVRA